MEFSLEKKIGVGGGRAWKCHYFIYMLLWIGHKLPNSGGSVTKGIRNSPLCCRPIRDLAGESSGMTD